MTTKEDLIKKLDFNQKRQIVLKIETIYKISKIIAVIFGVLTAYIMFIVVPNDKSANYKIIVILSGVVSAIIALVSLCICLSYKGYKDKVIDEKINEYLSSNYRCKKIDKKIQQGKPISRILGKTSIGIYDIPGVNEYKRAEQIIAGKINSSKSEKKKKYLEEQYEIVSYLKNNKPKDVKKEHIRRYLDENIQMAEQEGNADEYYAKFEDISINAINKISESRFLDQDFLKEIYNFFINKTNNIMFLKQKVTKKDCLSEKEIMVLNAFHSIFVSKTSKIGEDEKNLLCALVFGKCIQKYFYRKFCERAHVNEKDFAAIIKEDEETNDDCIRSIISVAVNSDYFNENEDSDKIMAFLTAAFLIDKSFYGMFSLFDNFDKEFTVYKNYVHEKQIESYLEKETVLIENNQRIININDVDMMTGKEFEEYLANMFKQQGYKAMLTKDSNDQGIDVILEKDGQLVGVQAKCYSGNVGNSAVQEAIAGKRYYNLDKVMVVTNRYFTLQAKALARANEVILWDREILMTKM